ncbi:MAG: MATE family efflux transporter [Gammaproteobacteria bacterium]
MQTFIKENKQLLILAIPLIVNYFIEGCPNFVNNAMIAHLGQTQLAAGAVVSSAFTGVLVFFYGILAAASTLISHHYGAKEKRQIGEVVRDAILLAGVCCVLLFILLYYGTDILRWAGQPPALVALAAPYLHGLMFAVIPDFATMVLWQFFIGLGRPKVTLVSSFLYVPINILANYTLMFGHFGFPALGMFGIGLGTAIGFWMLFVGMFAYIWWQPQYRQYFNEALLQFNTLHIKPLIKIGLPMGVMWGIDVSFGMFAAFFAGKLGTTLLAAQQIGVQVTGLTFLVIAGLAQAITVRIGHTWGAKNYGAANAICLSGFLMCFSIGMLFSLLLWFKPLWIIGIDFNLSDPANAAIIKLATEFLLIFGFYQLANSMRYAFFAVLRALKDTYFPALCSLVGFYGIAIGLGYPLLFHWGGNLFQFWYLTTAAIMLIVGAMYWRFTLRVKQTGKF